LGYSKEAACFNEQFINARSCRKAVLMGAHSRYAIAHLCVQAFMT